MRLRHCPFCHKSAKVIRLSKYKYYIQCSCNKDIAMSMQGKNPIDLTESWNKWVRLLDNMTNRQDGGK